MSSYGQARNSVRVGAGLGAIAVIALIVAVSIGLFRGSFTDTVEVTVISERAGLVMNPDAKVKMRGVQIGTVRSIEYRSDGTAAVRLDLDPSQLPRVPGNVRVEVASSTVFGAKFVQFIAPEDPAGELQPGQVLRGDTVTVEVNTIFQQLVQVLDAVEPEKLNQTLGAIAQAFGGRGEKFGQSLSDLNELLATVEPSLPALASGIESSVPAFEAYGDASTDIAEFLGNTTTLSNTVIEEQQALDQFLISATGLADLGTDVLGSNRAGLTDVARVLVPTAELLNAYHESLWCGIAGLIPFAKSPPQFSGVLISAGLTLGAERYRYPRDLPKVAASSGGRSHCQELGLPELPAEFVPPLVVADAGTIPSQYGNAGILLNSEGLKNWLFGPLPGPPRNTAQIGMPG